MPLDRFDLRLYGSFPDDFTDTVFSMALVGYAWLSTEGEAAAVQLHALDEAGCDPVFTDLAPGAKGDRPRLGQAVVFARRGDVVVVPKLDHLGSSIVQLLETVSTLAEKGAGLRSLAEGVDTTVPGGELVFRIFGALAEFQRGLIHERTRPGLSAAAANERKGGRKPSVTPEKLARAKLHIEAGLTVREAAARIKVGKTALYKALGSSDANARS